MFESHREASLENVLSRDDRDELVKLIQIACLNMRNVLLEIFDEEPVPLEKDQLQVNLKDNAYSSFSTWENEVLQRVSEVVKVPINRKFDVSQPRIEHQRSFPMIAISTPLACLDINSRLTILESLLLLMISLKTYDARSRVLLIIVTCSLHLSFEDLIELENRTAESLAKTLSDLTAEEESKKRAESSQISRQWKVGLASAAGAAVIGISGGLAAPLVAAGIGSLLGGIGLGSTTAAAYLGAVAGSSALVGTLFGVYGGRMSGEVMERYAAEIEDFSFLPLRPETKESTLCNHMRVTIGVSGWITTPEEFKQPWMSLSTKASELYALQWETTALLNLGKAFDAMISNYAWGYVKSEIIKRTVLATLWSALWPIGLLKWARVIDNPYSIVHRRSEKAGLVLADALLNQVQGRRPVTLIGYGQGARLIYYCLLELARRGGFGVVHDVYFFGAPIPAGNKTEWQAIRAVVAGRVVNGYSASDWILGFMERSSTLSLGITGLQRIERPKGIENINLGIAHNGDTLVDGHLRYSQVMGLVLQECGLQKLGELNMTEVGNQERVLERVREAETRQDLQEGDRLMDVGGT